MTQPESCCSYWCQCRWHSPSLGVVTDVSVGDTARVLCSCWCQCFVTKPESWCCYWCQCRWHSPSLAVVTGVSVGDTARVFVFLLESLCNCDSSSRGVLADANVLWHSSSLGILAAGSVLCFVFLHLAGVHLLWHNPNLHALVPFCCVTSQVLELLLVSEYVTPPKSWCSCWCQFLTFAPSWADNYAAF